MLFLLDITPRLLASGSHYLPPPAQAQAQAQPAQAQAQPLPPEEEPPLPPEEDARALKTSPVTLSAPLRLIKPPDAPFTCKAVGEIVEASLPAVFSVQPANPAATWLKLVFPPGATGETVPPEGTEAVPGWTYGRTHTG